MQIKTNYPTQVSGRAIKMQIPKDNGLWYTWFVKSDGVMYFKKAQEHCEALYKRDLNNGSVKKEPINPAVISTN